MTITNRCRQLRTVPDVEANIDGTWSYLHATESFCKEAMLKPRLCCTGVTVLHGSSFHVLNGAQARRGVSRLKLRHKPRWAIRVSSMRSSVFIIFQFLPSLSWLAYSLLEGCWFISMLYIFIFVYSCICQVFILLTLPFISTGKIYVCICVCVRMRKEQ